jgi:hypothetical protein
MSVGCSTGRSTGLSLFNEHPLQVIRGVVFELAKGKAQALCTLRDAGNYVAAHSKKKPLPHWQVAPKLGF